MSVTKTETVKGGGLLDSFAFDNDQEFFGIKEKESKSQTSLTVQNINDAGFDDEDDDDDSGSTTTIEETKPLKETKTPLKKVAEATTEEDDENEEEEEKVKEKAKVKTPENKKKKKEREEDEDDEEPEEHVFFGEKPTKETVKKIAEGAETTSKKEKVDEDSEEFFTGLAEELKEAGILSNVEIPEGKKLTQDEFIDSFDAEIETRVEDTIKALTADLGEDGKAYIKFLKNGGKTSQFLQVFAQPSFELEELDEDNEKQIKKVLKYYVENYEDNDPEDVADRIKFIEDSGKAKTQAKKFFKIIKEEETERKESLLREQEKADTLKAKNAEKFKTRVADALKKEAVGVLKLTKEDKAILEPFINKPSVKVGKGKYIPAFQVALAKTLRAETPEDLDALIFLAKLYKDGFNIEGLVTNVKTGVTKEIRKGVRDGRSGLRIHGGGSSSGVTKSLTDYFD